MSQFTICCTGLSSTERDQCFESALRSGGSYKRDFNSCITHLICRPGCKSEKYLAALEAGIPIVHPDWLLQSTTGPKNASMLLRQADQFRIRAFQDTVICITGHSIEEREAVSRAVAMEGGIFSPDLDRKCTHLIAEDSPGVALSTPKWQYAVRWGIRIVNIEWIWSCQKKGGRLPEEQFVPGAAATLASAGAAKCRLFEQLSFHFVNGDEEVKRRLQKAGGKVVEAGEHADYFVVSDSCTQLEEQLVLLGKQNIVKAAWITECILKNELLAVQPYLVSCNAVIGESGSVEKPQVFSCNTLDEDSLLNGDLKASFPSAGKKIFSGCCIYIVKEAFPSALEVGELSRQAQENGALISLTGKDASHIVVSWGFSQIWNQSAALASNAHVTTDIWLLSCAFEGKMFGFDEHMLFSPSRVHLSKLKKITALQLVAITGFEGIERELLIRAIGLCGYKYVDKFSKKCAFLVYKEPSSVKYSKAVEWKVPLRTQEFIFDALRQPNNNNNSSNSNGKLQFLDANGISPFLSPASPCISVGCPVETQDFLQVKPPNGTSCNNTLFKGLVFFLSQRLWHRRIEMGAIVEELGGCMKWNLDSTCTHFIHHGMRQVETFKEFKQAKAQKCFIVSPWWLLKCKELNMRVSEQDYPHTFAPNKGLNMIQMQTQPPIEEITSFGAPLEAIAPSICTVSSTLKRNSNIFDEIDSLIQSNGKRQRAAAFEKSPFLLKVQPIPSSTVTEIIHLDGVEDQEFDPLTSTVKYADAEYENAKNTLLQKLCNAPSPKLLTVPKQSNAANDLVSTQKKVFMISTVSESQRTAMTKLIARCGGTILNASAWEATCTHLLAGSLARSEKYLAAVASGCWVLNPVSFLAACKGAGKLVAEEAHEWSTNDTGDCAQAARFWRLSPTRPFDGWNVMLYTSNTKTAPFARIFAAGGGRVHEELGNCKNMKHVFVENESFVEKVPRSVKMSGIPLVKIEYISDYLIQKGNVQVKDYLVTHE